MCSILLLNSTVRGVISVSFDVQHSFVKKYTKLCDVGITLRGVISVSFDVQHSFVKKYTKLCDVGIV